MLVADGIAKVMESIEPIVEPKRLSVERTRVHTKEQVMLIVFDMATGSVEASSAANEDYSDLGYEAAHPVVLIGEPDHRLEAKPREYPGVDEAEAFLERIYNQI
jgi:hypothetical protein